MNRQKIENISTSVTEPVDIDDARTRLVIDGNDEDLQIEELLIPAARQKAEAWANRTIASQQFRLTLDKFKPVIRLPRTPVISIDTFSYVDVDGNTQTLSSGTGYHFSNNEFEPELIPPYGEYWPNTQDGYEKVIIEFTAGFAAVAEDVKTAILAILGDLLENREDSAPIQLHRVPLHAQLLLSRITKERFIHD